MSEFIVARTTTEIKEDMLDDLVNGVGTYAGIPTADISNKGSFSTQYEPFAQREAEGDVKLQEISTGSKISLATGKWLTEEVKNQNKERKVAVQSEVFLDFTGSATILANTKVQVPSTTNNSSIAFAVVSAVALLEYNASTISFDATASTIDDSATGFTFSVGDYIQAAGSTSNNFTFYVDSVTTASLGVTLVYSTDTMITEVAGDDITITRVVQAKSLIGGSDKNVGAGTITQIQIPIAGVSGVTNVVSATGGDDEETDAVLRQRVIDDLPGASFGSHDWYKIKTKEVAGVLDAYVINGKEGNIDGNPTNVYIYPTISTGNGIPTQSFCDDIKTEKFSGEAGGYNKNITHLIYCQPPTGISINVTVTNFQVTSGSDLATVQAAVEASIEAYILALNIGDDVLVTDVSNSINDVAGVYDFTLTVPATNTAIGSDEKATTGTISIST